MVLRSTPRLNIAPNWLPDDTEESVLGTEWHQEAGHILADMLRDVARKRGVSWGVCEQVELRDVRHEDGRPYPMHPDVFVIGQPLDQAHDTRAVKLSQVGAPLFVAEIASRKTVKNDLEGKLRVYAGIGVPEYLVFDPTGDILGVHMRAWRQDPGQQDHYQPWEEDGTGYWHSRVLGIALRPRPRYLEIRDGDGEIIGLPVDNAARARAAERALQQETAARLALEEELRRLRARLEDGDGEQGGQ